MEISQGVLENREIVAGHEVIGNINVRKKVGAGEYFEEKNGAVDKRKI